MRSFLEKFAFDPNLRGFLGVEREFFLAHPDGRLAPDSPAFLSAVNDPAWTYELSACQVEHRTKPHRAPACLRADLREGQRQGEVAAARIGRRLVVQEVGPEDMPLDVYPHDARYAEIAARIPTDILRAACRVAGTHIHVGVGSPEEAIETHNLLLGHLDELIRLGDHSAGERMRLYAAMAPGSRPPRYDSFEHFFEIAKAKGFDDNPRNCWTLIRISRHGTVELRMFGMAQPDEIMEWVHRIIGLPIPSFLDA